MTSFEQIHCPVCNRDDFTVWAKSKTPARYVCCRTCGTLYANPRSPRSSRHAWLNDTFAMSLEWMDALGTRRPALVREAALIKNYLSRGHILDIGCSAGIFFEYFPRENWKYSGVELSPSAAAYAREMYNADVRVGMLRDANFPDESFDLVTMIDTICYLEDPYRDLCEVRRVLKDNGFLAIELPGRAYIMRRIRGILPLTLDGHWVHVDPASSYIFWPSPASLELMLERCGFYVAGWWAIPSPTRNSIAGFVSHFYFMLISFLTMRRPSFLTWAPKYICIARAKS